MPKAPKWISTGIYRTRELSEAECLDPRTWDITVEMDRLEKGALRIMRKHGGALQSDKTENGKRVRQWLPLPADAPPIAQRAKQLIFEIWTVRDDLNKLELKHPESVAQLGRLAFDAHQMGGRAQQVGGSRFEPAVGTGAKLRQENARAREGRTRERAPRNEKLRGEARRIKEGTPGMSQRSIARYLRNKFELKITDRQICNIIRTQ